MIKNNPLSINYQESGSGNPIFFIHGLGADHRMFQPQIEYFSKDYHVICPDLRGNGLSPKLKGPVDSILDKQCADVIKLMDELSIDKAIFSGVSYGGVFCFHFAINYGHRVAGLVISDSFSDTKILSIQDFLVMFSTYISLPLLYLPKLLLPLVKLQYKKWPLAQKHMALIFEDLRSHEVILQRLAINKANCTKDLYQLTCPVLGMVGDESKLLINLMKRGMDAIKDSHLVVLKGSFDPSNLCAEQNYNEKVIQFLGKLGW